MKTVQPKELSRGAHASKRPGPAQDSRLLACAALEDGVHKHDQKASMKAVKHLDLVDLDPVIHERTRLTILTALFTNPEPASSFSDLRDTLSLTDGNLLAHLRTLEQAGMIERIKEGAGRGSTTMIQLSAHGRKAFAKYLDQLETLVRSARGE